MAPPQLSRGLAGAALSILYAAGWHLLTSRVPEPYMDEEFHVRQTQQYCAGDFATWDPMITTFPGVYFVAFGMLQPAAVLLGQPLASTGSWLCSAPVLRLLNPLFGLLVFFCSADIIDILERDRRVGEVHRSRQPAYEKFKQLKTSRAGSTDGRRDSHSPAPKSPMEVDGTWGALTLSLCPLHFFFVFLFYTDLGANGLVLLAYALALRRRIWLSAVAGTIGVAFRQTNIVWCAFICCTAMARMVDDAITDETRSHAPSKALWRYLAGGWQIRGRLFSSIFPYLILAGVFVAFLKVNGGVVIGDRTAHAPVFHLPQLAYFLVFTFGLLAPYQLLRDGIRGAHERWSESGSKRFALVAGGVCTLGILLYAVHYHTFAHKYLLADNRHYTFYVWKLLFRREGTVGSMLRYLYCLVYLAVGWCIGYDLYSAERRMKHPLWLLLFTLCTALVLVPAELLEGRYFVLPFTIAALHSPAFANAMKDASVVPLPLLVNALVNAVTLYIFVARPFQWPDGSTARFMW